LYNDFEGEKRMSSYQQTRFSVTTRAQVTGNQTMDLSRLLGAGGCKLMLETLDKLDHAALTRNEESADLAQVREEGFQWACVDRAKGHFALTLKEALPAGVESLVVNLKMRDGLAEVAHDAAWRVTATQTDRSAATVPAAMHGQLRACANRTVNRLLALTVATQVTQRLQTKVQQTAGVRVRNAVSMRLTSQNRIQTMARLRVGS
jgi:hypothetical protein